MTALIKLRVQRKAIVKLKVLPKFPANVIANKFLTVVRAGTVFTFDVNYALLPPGPSVDPSTTYVAVLDAVSGIYRVISLADLIISGGGPSTVRVVTEAGAITVAANTRVLLMNRTADESPSNINLPLGSAKVGSVKIVDWKGNAGSFPHTVAPSGSEKFQGALSTWSISADGASAVFDPIPTLGYAV